MKKHDTDQLAPMQADSVDNVEETINEDHEDHFENHFEDDLISPAEGPDMSFKDSTDRLAEIFNDPSLMRRFKAVWLRLKPNGMYWQDEEDIFQETAVRFWLTRTEFRDEAKLSTFLHQIAVNVLFDMLRHCRAVKHGGSVEVSYIDSFEPEQLQLLYQGDGDENSILENLLENEEDRLSALTAEERKFVEELFYEYDGNISLFSEALKERGEKGYSRPSIYKVLHEIKDKLRPESVIS